MQVTLVLRSASASLEELEAALGISRLREHSRGTARATGIVRNESIWMKDWQQLAEPEEDGPNAVEAVHEAIQWLDANLIQIESLGALENAKILCCIEDNNSSFTIDPEMALELSRMKILLLIYFRHANSVESEA